jgi:hypothetical protein
MAKNILILNGSPRYYSTEEMKFGRSEVIRGIEHGVKNESHLSALRDNIY